LDWPSIADRRNDISLTVFYNIVFELITVMAVSKQKQITQTDTVAPSMTTTKPTDVWRLNFPCPALDL